LSFVGIMNDFTDECTLLERSRVPDGEGGWLNTWTDGLRFEAAILHDNTLDARIAESEGMHATYTVTTHKGEPLDFHDVFRRERDGKVFRATSDSTDVQTPQTATFQFCQASAEEWKLT